MPFCPQRLFSQALLIQHIVRLVKHEAHDTSWVHFPLDDHVHDRSRRPDDNVCCYWRSRASEGIFDAKEGRNGGELPHRLYHFGDLTSKFSRGGKANSLTLVVSIVTSQDSEELLRT